MEPLYIPEPPAPLTTEQKIDLLLSIVATKDDIAEIKTEIAELRETVDSHTTPLDGMAKRLDEVATNTAGLIQPRDRHERSIKQLATKAGLKT